MLPPANMAKSLPQLDVLILGAHPSAFLAAALLRLKTTLRVVHATIPAEKPLDRPVLVNPCFFKLHPLLEGLKRKLDLQGIYGLRFLADDPKITAESHGRNALGYIAELAELRSAIHDIARRCDVEFQKPAQVHIHRIDEKGIEVTLGHHEVHPRAMIVAGRLSEQQHRVLGMPTEWERGVLHRYTYARVRNAKLLDLDSRPIIPMSLDLRGTLSWAWLLPAPKSSLLAVEQPSDSVQRHHPHQMLRHWTTVLAAHGLLRSPIDIPDGDIESVDMPLAGALAHEGVASRSLLVGPAGGFYTANAEDIYPACWSAIHAADVMKAALKERHLQDALQPYRQKWRTTLGDYLRGPQQNLRFLLPLIYRNPVMTSRLCDAILIGKSVVR